MPNRPFPYSWATKLQNITLLEFLTFLLMTSSVCQNFMNMHVKVSEKEEKNTPCANPYTAAADIIYLINDVEKPTLAMPDWSVTSGTGLTMMPERRCRTNFFSGIPAFRHLFIPAEASWFSSLLVCSARKTNWAMLHPTELSYNLLSCPEPFWVALQELRCCEIRCTPLSYVAFYWAMLHPPELPRTFLSYTAVYQSTLHPLELRCTLLSYAAPSWAMLHPTELRCTFLSYTEPS